jgi:GxxExxY protein
MATSLYGNFALRSAARHGQREQWGNGDGGDMEIDPYQADSLTSRIIYCVLRVHQTLGPGFLESVYRRALIIELTKQNLAIEIEKQILIYYDGQKVGRHKLDLIVEGKVILELKNAERFCKAHYAQVRSYLKAAKLEKALLINFADNRADVRRITISEKGSSPLCRDAAVEKSRNE